MRKVGSHQLLLEEGDTPETVATAIFGSKVKAPQLTAINRGILEAHGREEFEPGDILAIPPGWEPRASEVLPSEGE